MTQSKYTVYFQLDRKKGKDEHLKQSSPSTLIRSTVEGSG